MFSRDLGIDLGTANILVFIKNKGIVINEPSVVAKDTNTNKVRAVGEEAKMMIGRTPGNIVAIRPLKDGVIADYETTQAMLKYFMKKAITKGLFSGKPRVVICVPAGVTEVEKRAVLGAAEAAGAKGSEIYLVEESKAAALGAGLPISEPVGSMVVDIGGGTSEVAVISLGGIVATKSIRVGGDRLDEYIVTYVKKEMNLAIGERTAEEIKKTIGNACDINATEIETMSVRGRDLVSGLPKVVQITSTQVRQAIEEPVNAIIDAIKFTLEKTPPELSSDVMESGIMLTGGGALLKGLDKLVSDETGMPVFIADEPLNCVALGTGIFLENIDLFRNQLVTAGKTKF